MAVKEGVMVGCGEVGDLDYVVVKGKVRKRDKDGNDISADKLGTGGRRREDDSLVAVNQIAYVISLIADFLEEHPDVVVKIIDGVLPLGVMSLGSFKLSKQK